MIRVLLQTLSLTWVTTGTWGRRRGSASPLSGVFMKTHVGFEHLDYSYRLTSVRQVNWSQYSLNTKHHEHCSCHQVQEADIYDVTVIMRFNVCVCVCRWTHVEKTDDAWKVRRVTSLFFSSCCRSEVWVWGCECQLTVRVFVCLSDCGVRPSSPATSAAWGTSASTQLCWSWRAATPETRWTSTWENAALTFIRPRSKNWSGGGLQENTCRVSSHSSLIWCLTALKVLIVWILT